VWSVEAYGKLEGRWAADATPAVGKAYVSVRANLLAFPAQQLLLTAQLTDKGFERPARSKESP